MTFPANEADTIELFRLAQEYLGWRIVRLQSRYPDAIIENKNGIRLKAEFEYRAQNFQIHGHRSNGCDLIICWQDDWEEASLPVWALRDCIPPWVLRWQEKTDEMTVLHCRMKAHDAQKERLALLDSVREIKEDLQEVIRKWQQRARRAFVQSDSNLVVTMSAHLATIRQIEDFQETLRIIIETVKPEVLTLTTQLGSNASVYLYRDGEPVKALEGEL